MKNLVLVVVAVFVLTTFIGCNKKKEQEAFDNGVSTENSVSVSDNSAQNVDMSNSIPVVVENSSAASQEVSEPAMAPSSAAAASRPSNSKQIQQALKNAGFYSGAIDGKIGPMTKRAVEAFQKKNGLKADGKVGPKTWQVLSGYLNKDAEVPNPSAESQAVAQ
ncbi:MAG: peptidoglycan-binding protein [Candidatus Omnitrophica bacterium]|nr:peptidoglycan-binding protein [Candidatus Omnitrophota bacterium]